MVSWIGNSLGSFEQTDKQSELALAFPYEVLCQQIKPGDVIAFSGNDIPATVVKLATSSCYVHLAIVLSVGEDAISQAVIGRKGASQLLGAQGGRGQDSQGQDSQGQDGEDREGQDREGQDREGDRHLGDQLILIAESHISLSQPSLGTGKRNFGAQIHHLSQRLITCPDRAWWAALKQPLSQERMRQMQRWLWEIEQQGVPYDFVQAIGAGMDRLIEGCLEPERDDSSLFCSELVTCALQYGGAIAEHINPAEQTPADVMQFSCFEPPVLLKG